MLYIIAVAYYVSCTSTIYIASVLLIVATSCDVDFDLIMT